MEKDLEHPCPWLELIPLDETDSTSNQIKLLPIRREMTVVTAEYQTKGRGQQGNSWESERGMNLVFSILISPKNVIASQQFILSQAISLAIKDTLSAYTTDICIKWPNDIYWHDQKLGGILIENELCGKRIDRCVIGIGLNINQQSFTSPAPNPISLAQITGKRFDRQEVLLQLLSRFHQYLKFIEQNDTAPIVSDYHQSLYRAKGLHAYRDEQGLFMAAIDHIEPIGTLCLKDESGNLRYYAFKEVKVVLPHLELPN